jgi:hypothetical protein
MLVNDRAKARERFSFVGDEYESIEQNESLVV